MGAYFSAGLSKSDIKFLKSHTKFNENEIRSWYDKFLQECPDGKMNRRKLTKMYLELYPDGDVIEYCGFVFALTDIDKSGYIDFKEFLQMINLASTSSPEEKLRWTFRLADTNGDGHIDFKEMMGIVNAMYRLLDDGGPVTWTYPMIEARTKEIFAQMGYDENNVLSEREFIIGCMNDMNIANLVLYRKGILP